MLEISEALEVAVGSWDGLELVDWTCAESVLYDTSASGKRAVRQEVQVTVACIFLVTLHLLRYF